MFALCSQQLAALSAAMQRAEATNFRTGGIHASRKIARGSKA
jgi:hypothetical protein